MHSRRSWTVNQTGVDKTQMTFQRVIECGQIEVDKTHMTFQKVMECEPDQDS